MKKCVLDHSNKNNSTGLRALYSPKIVFNFHRLLLMLASPNFMHLVQSPSILTSVKQMVKIKDYCNSYNLHLFLFPSLNYAGPRGNVMPHFLSKKNLLHVKAALFDFLSLS